MYQMYQFAVLDPRPTDDANAANDAVFATAAGVYGVEVTVPALAARCELGNLDPQHTEGLNVAACVAALDCPLPPDGATLVTVRPDADSVLAMAVIALRADGQQVDRALVELIGAADCAPNGPWARDYSRPAAFSAASSVAMNHRIPLAERVATLAGWLRGAVRLPEPAPADHSAVDVTVAPGGRYVVARADGPAGRDAMAAGYRHAPVVIAVNEEFSLCGEDPHRKYTLARWNITVPLGWDDMLAELQDLEPGWAGSSSICGSPQGVGSTLTLEQVRAVVERHLPPSA